MTIEEITTELSKLQNYEIDLIIANLLRTKRLSFTEVSQIYVQYLEDNNHQHAAQLCEASTCIVQTMMNNKITDHDTSDRCIHFLDQTEVYLTDGLKEKFKYDEENGRKLSHYKSSI